VTSPFLYQQTNYIKTSNAMEKNLNIANLVYIEIGYKAFAGKGGFTARRPQAVARARSTTFAHQAQPKGQ